MPRSKKEDNANNLMKELEIDKKTIANEIKNEVKDSLEDEIIDTIDNYTKDKLDSMEKKIYKYKNRTIRKRNIIIIILLIIIGLETKLLLDGFNLNDYLKINTEINNEKIDDQEEKKDLAWYIDKYSYLLDMIHTNLDNDNFSYLYEKSYKVSDIDNNVKLNIAYQLLDSKDITNNNSVIMISNDNLKNNYNKLFNDNNYKEENFNNGCINFIYNKSNDNYMAIDIECNITKSIKEEISNIYEEDDKIIIETILGVYDSNDNTLKMIDGSIIEENYNGKLDNYKNSLNKYQYIFIKDNDNYYFDAIEKIK